MDRNRSAAGDWEKAFDEAWDEFKATLNAIGPLPASKLIPGLEDIFRRKTFNKPLDDCPRQTWDAAGTCLLDGAANDKSRLLGRLGRQMAQKLDHYEVAA